MGEKINYIPARYSNDTLEGLARIAVPKQFIGSHLIDHSIANNILDSKRTGYAPVRHLNALIPLVEKFAERVKQDNVPGVAPLFLKEIADHTKTKSISEEWFLLENARYARAISRFSSDEVDFYMGISPIIFASFVPYRSWKTIGNFFKNSIFVQNASDIFGMRDEVYNMLSDYLTGEAHLETYPYNVSTGMVLHHVAQEQVASIVASAQPKCIYPVYEVGYLGVSFLMKCYINQVFPVSLHNANTKDSKLRAHSLRMSPFSFALHDLIHALNDSFVNEYGAHIINTCENAMDKGVEPNRFIENYLPIAQMRCKTIQNQLAFVYELLVGPILQNLGKTEFLRGMVTLFMAIHENSAYNKNMFSSNDLQSIFCNLLVKNQGRLLINDEFKTCPYSGESPLSDNEIARIAFGLFDDYVHLPEKMNIEYYATGQKKSFLWENYLSSFAVHRNPTFIYVTFNFKNGQTIRYVSETLRVLWRNFIDYIELLKMAGTVIEMPILVPGETEKNRAAVFATSKTVEVEFKKMKRKLYAQLKYAIEAPDMVGASRSEKFFCWQFGMQQKVDKMVAELAVQGDTMRANLGKFKL